jgi:hypothetical protein
LDTEGRGRKNVCFSVFSEFCFSIISSRRIVVVDVVVSFFPNQSCPGRAHCHTSDRVASEKGINKKEIPWIREIGVETDED